MLLLLRHLESNKNTLKQFSSYSDNEELTKEGLSMGYKIAKYIEEFVDIHAYNVKRVYCANSARAIKTAKIIADNLGVEIMAFDELRSNKSGALCGKNEIDAELINPLFMKQLKLFRAGIYSSYDFEQVINRENKRDFEKRVNRCLNNIIVNDEGTLKIVVLHHSSLTAAVIFYARKFYNYPDDFYGHVACEFGNIYLINDNGIIMCNESACNLGKVNL